MTMPVRMFYQPLIKVSLVISPDRCNYEGIE